MSTASAGLAKKNGYNNVRVYLDGEPAWMENRLPTYSTKEFILNGNVVLIDIRPRKEAMAGRIKGAYSVPYEELEDKLDDVPRNAPIVLYGNEEVMDAVNDVRDMDFNFVSLVRDGYDGWVKSGGDRVTRVDDERPAYSLSISGGFLADDVEDRLRLIY